MDHRVITDTANQRTKCGWLVQYFNVQWDHGCSGGIWTLLSRRMPDEGEWPKHLHQNQCWPCVGIQSIFTYKVHICKTLNAAQMCPEKLQPTCRCMLRLKKNWLSQWCGVSMKTGMYTQNLLPILLFNLYNRSNVNNQFTCFMNWTYFRGKTWVKRCLYGA